MSSPPVQRRRGNLLGDALRRSYAWLILGALVGGLTGFGASLLRPAEFDSTVSVLVTPLPGNPYTAEDSRDNLTSLNSEAQIVSSETVLGRVRDEFEGSTEALLQPQDVNVTVPPNTQILQLTVTDVDAQGAQTLAQTLADTYLDYRQELAQEAVDQRADLVADQAKEVRSDLEQAERRAATTSVESEALVQRRLADSYQNDLFNLNAELAEIQGTATDAGRVTTPASAGVSRSALSRLILVAAPALLGALLAFAIAVARERGRPWVTRAADLEPETPVLTEWPAPVASRRGASNVEQPPHDAALRRLTGMVLASSDLGGALSVTSVSDDYQAYRLGQALSESMAQAGVPCVLVETSLPDDEVEQRASRIGLSDVLLTGADPVNLLAKVAPDLWYLPAGAQLAEAREHMVAPTLRKVVDRLRSSERMVVLVGPRTSSPEGAAVVAVCDRAVLCVTPGASTFHDVEQAREALAMVHTDLLGSVLTQPVKGRADRQASDRDGDGFIGSVFNDESPDDRDRHQP